MARTRDRASSVQPLIAVPTVPDLENEIDSGLVEEVPSSADAAPSARRLYDLTERVLELETRLGERVESERVLDAEVRSLQRDAELRLAYLSDLESRHQALRIAHEDLMRGSADLAAERDVLRSSLTATQTRADAEAHHRQALQSRAVVGLADSAARLAAGHPFAERAGMWAARKVARRLS